MLKSRTSYLVCGMLFLLLLAGGAQAAITISGVSISEKGNQEILHVFIETPSGGADVASACRDRAFKHAGYGRLEISNAKLAGGERSMEYEGRYLQGVELKSGLEKNAESVRVVFYLKEWTAYRIDQKKGEIRVIFPGKAAPAKTTITDSDMYFSLSTDDVADSGSVTFSDDPLNRVMNTGDDNQKPILMAQTGQQEQKEFYIPSSEKMRRPSETTAPIPEEDIFAQLVTLRFKDTELQNVIRMIAQKTGLNVIMARDKVKGTITLNLEDVPLGSALDAILKTHQLAFVREAGGIVRIVPRSEIQATTIELKTVHIPVNWVPATKLAETLRPFLSSADGAQIQADAESNALIITDTPPQVNDTFITLVEKLDIPEKQVMIEMRLADIGREAQRQLGSNWSLTQQLETTQTPLYEEVIDEITGNVIGVTPTGEFLEVTEDKIADTFESGKIIGAAGGSSWSWGKAVGILGDDFNFDVFAQAYEEEGLVKVLANPKIITLNNVPATIEIIEEIPYRDTVIGSGGAQTEKAEFKETGITMGVTPNITNNGYVRMQISPEQKIYRGPASTDDSTPKVDTRSAETNVIVRDEETVVLGGLRRYTDTLTTSGTPWFRNIPVLGWLFKNESKEQNVLELVMFVTPHIIKEPTLTDKEKLMYEQIDYCWDLPEDFYTCGEQKR